MLKATLSELRVKLDLEVAGPLLVKEREWEDEEKEKYKRCHNGQDPPDMVWVRLHDREGSPYLPGSSIKGVLRSHAERIARTLTFPNFGCCNPFIEVKEGLAPTGEWDASCSDKFHQRERKGESINGVKAYHDACPICKLFGCAKLASRIRIDDADLENPLRPDDMELRDGVAIDRFTGGASAGAKYDMEVMVRGAFTTYLYLRNFECWQAGLLTYLLQDLKGGLLRFGYGKRRGLGKVNGAVRQIKLTYFGFVPQGYTDDNPIVAGVGSLTRNWGDEWGQYDFQDLSPVTPQPLTGALSQAFDLPTDLTKPPWMEIAQCWNQFIAQYSLPKRMQRLHFEEVSGHV